MLINKKKKIIKILKGWIKDFFILLSIVLYRVSMKHEWKFGRTRNFDQVWKLRN